MPTVPPSTPPTPPAPAKPAPTPAATIKKPKLNIAERRAVNNAIESVQEWVAANETAIREQTNAKIDEGLAWLSANVKPTATKAIDWATAKVAALKL